MYDYKSDCCAASVSVLGTCTGCLMTGCAKTLYKDGQIYISDTDCERGKAVAKASV